MLFFSRQVEKGIRKHALFGPGERILVALSGGKDSLALMHQLSLLGYDVTGLHIDLAIPGSSDKARQSVEAFCARFGLDLIVVETEEHGLPIPEVRAKVKRPICSLCGKIKRYFFNKTAMDQGFDVLATGHNLDDEVGRLFSNLLRWDRAYLSDQGPVLEAENGFARKVKPLFRVSEFETANYCFMQGIEYHVLACPYSKGASSITLKNLWADLEEKMPGQKLSFYQGYLKEGRRAFQALEKEEGAKLSPCKRCAYPTSAELCSVCRIKDML